MPSKDSSTSSPGLAALFGDTFPSQLYACLETTLGLTKSTTVLKTVFNNMKTKPYDHKSVFYNGCQPQHRKKQWAVTQVLMEVQLSVSMTAAMQIKEMMQPLMSSWLKGGAKQGEQIDTSPETERLNTAFNSVYVALMTTMKEHPASTDIMMTLNINLMAEDIDKSQYLFDKAPKRVHNTMRGIIMALQALGDALGEEEATTVKWQIQEAVMKDTKSDTEEWVKKCFNLTGFPKLPEDPKGGIFNIAFDPRMFGVMTGVFPPAKVTFILEAALKQIESEDAFDPASPEYAVVYFHRRKDFYRVKEVMNQVYLLGKPMEKAVECNRYIDSFLTEYSMKEDIQSKVIRIERSVLRPSFIRLIDAFVQKSGKVPTCRNIWEDMDEDLRNVAFNLEDRRWSHAPKGVRYELHYLNIAFKAVKKWSGEKTAEDLKFHIKEQLLQDTKKSKKESKLAVKCLEITGYDKAKKQFVDDAEESEPKEKKLTEEELKAKTTNYMFEVHTFMIGVRLALLYDLKREIRQAVVQKLNMKLSRQMYDPKARHLAVVEECARKQVWLSGLILSSVEQVIGRQRRDKMENEVRMHMTQHSTQRSLEDI